MFSYIFVFFNDPAPTEIYTLSLHDALPILVLHRPVRDVADGVELGGDQTAGGLAHVGRGHRRPELGEPEPAVPQHADLWFGTDAEGGGRAGEQRHAGAHRGSSYTTGGRRRHGHGRSLSDGPSGPRGRAIDLGSPGPRVDGSAHRCDTAGLP